MTTPRGSVDPKIRDFLRRPGVLSAEGPDHEIETHAGHVFLAGDTAWKLKKDVRFSYLDFSSPRLRQAALQREFSLNGSHAPEIYLGLSFVTESTDGGLSVDGKGRPIEAMLRMRRFAQADLFDRMAESNRLEQGHIEALARVVRRMHDQAPPPGVDLDAAGVFRAVVEDNFAAFAQHPKLFSNPRLDQLASTARTHLNQLRDLLRARMDRGYVRRCHGDLHLGNIVLWQGTPTAFDALEFDEVLATTDLHYDLAFLLMDLLHRGLEGHANLLWSDYLIEAESEELEGLQALPLFLSTRAAVRAKVEADRAGAIQAPTQRSQAEGRARAYFELALDSLQPFEPRLLAVGGLSGTGKTTLARSLAVRTHGPLGALVLRSDQERRALAGVPIGRKLPPEWYEPDVNVEVYRRLHKKADAALRSGISVIIDAVHGRPEERHQTGAVAEDLGLRFQGLWLEADPETLIERVDRRVGDASDADAEVVRRQLSKDPGLIDWHPIDSTPGADAAARQARAELGL
ncbi:MAG: AAA family ATPase [Myxococcota bacterium]